MRSLHHIILFSLFYFFSCSADSSGPKIQDETFVHDVTSAKINGASMVAASMPVDDEEFHTLDSLHVNTVCLLPFAYVRTGIPIVHYNAGSQWWGESPEGIAECIRMAHANGMKVMVKPQLWMSEGKYTGQLCFSTEEEWQAFEKSYSQYLFRLLPVADSLHAEWFCIGTELNEFAKQRKSYWSSLIDSVKKVYHGKITYAENWDCYKNFPFWNRLDAIGINAYFPLSDSVTPEVSDLLSKWDPWYQQMKSFSKAESVPVMFTEYGYRSIDCATKTPWESYTDGNCNLVAQKNAYEALYQKFWNEPWFQGGFFWKWFDQHTPTDVPIEKDFSPQNKPVTEVIRQWYRQN